MPTARETLLDAAHAAVCARPWANVRMVEIAASAGVSRQTLYNEFGSKEGLGAALVRQRVDRYVRGTAAVLAQTSQEGADPAARCAACFAWMLRTLRREPLVRAALTGCWGSWMRLPAGALPGTPVELLGALRSHLVAGLARDTVGDVAALSRACEVGLRLTLSYVVAPERGAEEENGRRIGDAVRALLR